MSTVLIIEADPQLCRRWGRALESSRHSVLMAQAVTDGINRVREGGIDLVLLDPGDGHEPLDRFLDALGRLPDPPPFVLVSSSPRAPEISAQVGAAAFLPKPCMDEDIIEVTERFASLPIYDLDDEPTEPRGDMMRFLSS